MVEKIMLPILLVCLVPALALRAGSIEITNSTADLGTALLDLEMCINGTGCTNVSTTLSQLRTFSTNATTLRTYLGRAFRVINLFESTKGCPFGFSRSDTTKDLQRSVLTVMQGLVDLVYTADLVKNYTSEYNDKRFACAFTYPGAVKDDYDKGMLYNKKLLASNPKGNWYQVMYESDSTRRPTGLYLYPGRVARVDVPAGVVGKGFQIRVGAHSWDLTAKPIVTRLDRISLLYQVKSQTIYIASPLGGNIYVEVPYGVDMGLQAFQFQNVAPAPFFSAKPWDNTTLESWSLQKNYSAPFADFESEKFMMTVPTPWLKVVQHNPVELMQKWDKAMDAVSELFGHPLLRYSKKTVLYSHIDTIYRGTANFPGYPMSNSRFDPTRPNASNGDMWYLRSPIDSPGYSAIAFHELGHAQLFNKFLGETEAAVNFPYVAVQNRKFCVPLQLAFARSFTGFGDRMTIDAAAIELMTHFPQGGYLPDGQTMYQHKGYAKYADIVRLYGWAGLEKFFLAMNVDYTKGISYPRTETSNTRILRMSKAIGVDITPLIAFWGRPPTSPTVLKQQMLNASLFASQRILTLLQKYKTMVPANNSEFRAFAKAMYGRTPTNTQHQEGYYTALWTSWNETTAAQSRSTIDKIINEYFPQGVKFATEPVPRSECGTFL